MLAYTIRRLLGAIPTLFLIVTVAFFMMRAAPGGPMTEERALPPEIEANVRAAYDLDKPVWRQYAIYLGKVLRGDFGPSYRVKDFTVSQLLAAGFPASLRVGGTAMLLALLVGTTLGAIAALHQNRPGDWLVMGGAMTGITVPNFVTAPLLTLVLGVWLGLLPVGGWGGGSLPFLILPVITLALPQIATIARLTRGSMVEVLRQNWIRTARAKGLPEHTTIMRHAMKAALLPVVSYLGPASAGILTGSVVVETIFGIPGIGRYFIQGALNRDYTLVMGTVIVFGTLVVLLNLLVDLAYGLLDPKVKLA